MAMKKLLVLGFCLWCGTAMGAYDFAQDFIHTDNNPNGVWAYGFIDTNNGNSFTAYNSHTVGDAYLWNWCLNGDPDTNGNVNKAFGGSMDHPEWNGMSWEDDMACAMTNNSSESWTKWTTVAFIAPSAGQWSVAISFENRVMGGAETRVFVAINGTPVLLDAIDGFAGSSHGAPAVAPVTTDGYMSAYNGTVTLAQGDTVAFGAYGDGLHQVAMEANIDVVPEPATLSLLAAGAVMGLIRRNRR